MYIYIFYRNKYTRCERLTQRERESFKISKATPSWLNEVEEMLERCWWLLNLSEKLPPCSVSTDPSLSFLLF